MFLTEIKRTLAIAGAMVLAILTFGHAQRQKGRQEALRQAKEKDHDQADRIRDRVRNVRVSDDDIRYRD